MTVRRHSARQGTNERKKARACFVSCHLCPAHCDLFSPAPAAPRGTATAMRARTPTQCLLPSYATATATAVLASTSTSSPQLAGEEEERRGE
jgi:hypothetical protein